MANPDKTLDAVLLDWDGTRVAPLKTYLKTHSADPEFGASVVSRIGSGNATVDDAATWLLKAGLDSGMTLNRATTDILLTRWSIPESPHAILHLCQIVRMLDLDAGAAPGLCAWLEQKLDHARPFIRAWALDAVVSLASRHPACQNAAETALAAAETDPAASVRARARNLSGVKRPRRGL